MASPTLIAPPPPPHQHWAETELDQPYKYCGYQRLGIMWRVSQPLARKSLYTIKKTHVRCVMEYFRIVLMIGAPTTLKKIETIQDKVHHLIGTPFTTFDIHSLDDWGISIYKMHCSNSPRLLRQQLPHPWPLPSRRTRAVVAWKQTAWKFTSQSPTILMWKDSTVLSLLLGQRPGTASLTALWVYVQQMACISS